MAPVAIPETIARHISAPDLFFVSKVANVQSTPYPNPGVLFYPSGERTLGTRLVLPLALARFYLSPMQTDATLLANNSQHCWISRVASVCTLTLFYVVGSCCTKFETGQKFIDVQTDGTTPNMLGQQCWEFLHINSGKRTKSGRDTVVLKFSFFLFFIPTEPVIWLVVLCSFRNTKQSPLQILRAFCSGQRGQRRLWETGICH